MTALATLPASPDSLHGHDAFDGPLDLLVAAVRDHKIDLLGVDLRPVCEAYFRYVADRAEADLDAAAAALTALAYLLERKAWLLIPVPEPEPDPYEETLELPEPTVAGFADAIAALDAMREERQRLFFRAAGSLDFELPYVLADVGADDLARAFRRVLERAEKPEFYAPASEKRRSLETEIRRLLGKVDGEFRSLADLLEPGFRRDDVVYGFLGILELIRQGRVVARNEDGDVLFARAQPLLALEVTE